MSKIGTVLMGLPQLFMQDKAKGWNRVIAFELTGDEPGSYTAVINNQILVVHERQADRSGTRAEAAHHHRREPVRLSDVRRGSPADEARQRQTDPDEGQHHRLDELLAHLEPAEEVLTAAMALHYRKEQNHRWAENLAAAKAAYARGDLKAFYQGDLEAAFPYPRDEDHGRLLGGREHGDARTSRSPYGRPARSRTKRSTSGSRARTTDGSWRISRRCAEQHGLFDKNAARRPVSDGGRRRARRVRLGIPDRPPAGAKRSRGGRSRIRLRTGSLFCARFIFVLRAESDPPGRPHRPVRQAKRQGCAQAGDRSDGRILQLEDQPHLLQRGDAADRLLRSLRRDQPRFLRDALRPGRRQGFGNEKRR
ncbi:MAG: hypothetical protein MZU97_12715 [Bacillus subtilis]|nr:hypothetical protein [Bacillus subtilis]